MEDQYAAETEKVTINLPPVDLGKIDLLVEQGLFASRTDVIRSGIRQVLEEHDGVVKDAVSRRSVSVGVVGYGKSSLERMRKSGQRVRVGVVGVLFVSSDVTPDLADAVFESIWIRGALRAPREVVERLGAKVDRGPRSRG